MDFKQKEKIKNNQEKYRIENLKIARDFSKGLLEETKELTRSIVIFGSNANDTLNENSDIDIMVVLDNVSVFVTPELKEAYRIITEKLMGENNKIHLFNVNLTDLWDMARKGDPILINILRFGVPLFDRDLVEPMQYLLEIGKIRPTKEAIFNYISRSETLLEDVDKHIQNSIFDLYYSLVDMVHATLMCSKIMPPSPREMPQIFKDKFKNHKQFKGFSKDIVHLYDLVKKIEYKKPLSFNGEDLDKLKIRVSSMIFAMKGYCREKLNKTDNFEL